MQLKRFAPFSGPSALDLALLIALLASCSGGSSVSVPSHREPASSYPITSPGTGPRPVRLTWAPNREKAVNSNGGGYRVYYSQNPSFAVPGGALLEVPYASGTYAPTSALVSNLTPGLWYFYVVAYSALKPSGSAPSSRVVVQVP